MKVLGVRASTKEVRYALVDIDGQDVNFLNANIEHRLVFPRGMDEVPAKLAWLRGEFVRILDENRDVEKIILKTSEYVRHEKAGNRFTAYAEGVLLTLASQKGISISIKRYTDLGTGSKRVQGDAERIAGTSDKIWNTQMADALFAACSGRNS